MRKGIYKTLFIQLGIFLCYQSILFYSGNLSLLFPVISIHSIILFFITFRLFRKKETQKALAFLVPLLVVLLIGIGSCGGIFAMTSATSAEGLKEKLDAEKAHRLERQEMKRGDTARNMGTKPNKHKGQKESGIPNRRYHWLKKGSR